MSSQIHQDIRQLLFHDILRFRITDTKTIWKKLSLPGSLPSTGSILRLEISSLNISFRNFDIILLLISGLSERYPEGGNGSSFQYSCLENSLDSLWACKNLATEHNGQSVGFLTFYSRFHRILTETSFFIRSQEFRNKSTLTLTQWVILVSVNRGRKEGEKNPIIQWTFKIHRGSPG